MIEKKPKNDFCRKGRSLEKMAMGAPLHPEERKRLKQHLNECDQCRNAFSVVRRLYEQINNELQRPVHNKVLDLAKCLSSADVEYGLLICRPVSHNRTGSPKSLFCTELLFYANGSRIGAKEKLADFRAEEFQGYLTIRAMSDLQDHKLLLYLWQADCGSFAGWKLRLNDQEVDVSADGRASIPLCGIKELHGKFIQVEKSAESPSV